MKVEKEGSTTRYVLYLVLAIVALLLVYWTYVSVF